MLCSLCLVFSVSSGVSAVDGEAVTEDLDSLLTTSVDLYSNKSAGVALFSASTYAAVTPPTRNYTYDISKIDWYSTAPSAVSDVYKMAVVQSPDASSMEPFIFVAVVNDSKAVAFVGVNVGTAFRRGTNATTPYQQFAVGYTKGTKSFSTHYLYRAAFDADGKITEDWQLLTPSVWCSYSGSTAREFYYYQNTYATSNHVRDFFFSGCNASTYDVNNLTIIYDNYNISVDTNFRFGGFSSSSTGIPLYDSYNFPSISRDCFSLPTVEQWQESKEESRHKSLLERIKEIPSLIIEGLKSLFVPSDDYFSNYFNELKTFFSDRFGFLYELPEFAITLFTKLINFNPDESGYTMTFPKLQAPEVVDGDVVWHDVSSEQTFDFTFLEDQPFKTLYSVYKSLIWLGYCILLLNLIKRKSEIVFGGSSE